MKRASSEARKTTTSAITSGPAAPWSEAEPVQELELRGLRQLGGARHAGLDRGGADRVGAQALIGVLDGDGPREGVDRALRGTVGRAVGETREARRRAEIHDRALRREQMRDRLPRHQEGAVEIDRQDPPPEGERHLVHPLVGDDARVVAEHVESAEAFDAGRDARARLLLVADVGGARLDLRSELGHALGGLLEAGGDDVGQEERGALRVRRGAPRRGRFPKRRPSAAEPCRPVGPSSLPSPGA